MDADRRENCQRSYDLVADEYVRRIFDELQHKPLDRELLDRFAASVRDVGPACDIGCGPGHVARYLHERGVHVCGIDLSPEMINRARDLNPGIEFMGGDMRALPTADSSFAGIVAFYAIVNLPRKELDRAFCEMWRAFQPGGLLLVSFHVGNEVVHLEEWWDIKVSIDFHFFRTGLITDCLQAAGFQIKDILERKPYPEVEHQSRRAYILARKP